MYFVRRLHKWFKVYIQYIFNIFWHYNNKTCQVKAQNESKIFKVSEQKTQNEIYPSIHSFIYL